MKNRALTSISFAALAVGLGLSTSAASASMDCNLVPYLGADVQSRRMPFENNFGGTITKKRYPQGNIYAGLKFNEYFGFELGYARSKNLKRNVSVPINAITLGEQVSTTPLPGFTAQFQTQKTKLAGFHGNIVGFLPISQEYCLELFGSLGVARLKAHLKTRVVSFTDDDGVVDPTTEADFPTIEFKERKWIPRVTVGLQHMLFEQFGMRISGTWEKTSAFKNLKRTSTAPPNLFEGVARAKAKNSFIVGVGLFFNFN